MLEYEESAYASEQLLDIGKLRVEEAYLGLNTQSLAKGALQTWYQSAEFVIATESQEHTKGFLSGMLNNIQYLVTGMSEYGLWLKLLVDLLENWENWKL